MKFVVEREKQRNQSQKLNVQAWFVICKQFETNCYFIGLRDLFYQFKLFTEDNNNASILLELSTEDRKVQIMSFVICTDYMWLIKAEGTFSWRALVADSQTL